MTPYREMRFTDSLAEMVENRLPDGRAQRPFVPAVQRLADGLKRAVDSDQEGHRAPEVARAAAFEVVEVAQEVVVTLGDPDADGRAVVGHGRPLGCKGLSRRWSA